MTTTTTEELAHRIAWRYKKSSDPAHSDTYTFNRDTLLQFAEALRSQPQDADMAPAGEPVAFTVAGDVTNWARDFSKYRTQHYVRPVFATPPDHTAVMRQALAALENVSWGRSDEAITALRAALGEVQP